MLFIPGYVAMTKDDNARVGKLLACHALTMTCIAQDVHDTNSAMPNHNLALYWQLLYYLFLLDIALHSYHGRNGL